MDVLHGNGYDRMNDRAQTYIISIGSGDKKKNVLF